MTAPGTVLYSGIRKLEVPYVVGQEPRALQMAFGQLFDQAALAVHQAGSDLDEVLVDRILLSQDRQGKEHPLPVEFLSDAALIEREIRNALSQMPDCPPPDEVAVVAVRLIARLDQPPESGNRQNPH